MKTPLLSILCAWLICLANTSEGAISISLDVDTALDGIQSTRTLDPGDSFDVGIILDLTADSSLASYVFSVRYDANELAFVSFNETRPPDFTRLVQDPANSLSTTGEVDPVLETSNFGTFSSFSGAVFFNADSVGAGRYSLGSIRYTAVAPSDPGNAIDIYAGILATSDGFLAPVGNDTDSEDVSSSVVFNPGSVTVTGIPEPSSFAALGLAAIGLLGVRRFSGKSVKRIRTVA